MKTYGTTGFIARIFIFLSLFVAPLIFVPSVMDPALAPRSFYLAVFNLVFLVLIWSRRKDFLEPGKVSKLPFSLPLIFFALYLLVALLSFPIAINHTEFIADWLKYFNYFVFLLLSVIILRKSPDSHLIFTKYAVLLSIVIVGTGLVQFAGILIYGDITHQSSYFISSFFAHRNLYSQVLLLCLPINIYAFYQLKGFYKWTGLLMALAILLLIVILLVKSVWLALVMGIGFYALVNFRDFNFLKSKKGIIITTSSIIIICAAIIGIASIAGWDLIEKQFYVLQNYRFGSSLERIELWKRSIYMFYDNPLIGAGTGNWKIIHPSYGLENMSSAAGAIFFQRPHNDFLWILSENGIAGLLMILMFYLLVFRTGFREIKKPGNDDAVFIMIVLLVVFMFLVFSFFSFPRERIEHNIIVLLLIAIMLSKAKSDISIRFGSLMYFVLASVLIFSAIVFYHRLNSEFYTRLALNARSQNKHTEVIEYISRANNVFVSVDATSTPLTWYEGTAYYKLGMLKEAGESYIKAYDANPYHIHVLNNLGSYFEKTGMHQKAREMFRKTLLISPDFTETIMNLYVSEFNDGNIDKALELISSKDTIKSHPDYEKYLMAGIHALIEDLKGSVDEDELITTLQRINLREEWAIKVYKQSLHDKRTMRDQLLVESIYVICEIDKAWEADSCNKLKIKYNVDY